MPDTCPVVIAAITPILTSIIVLVWVTFRTSRAQPSEVLFILDRDVAILDDAHEDVLHDRHQEEQEAVHEQQSVNEIDFPH